MADFCKNCGALIFALGKSEVKCKNCGTLNTLKKSDKVISEKIDSKNKNEIKEEIGDLNPIVKRVCKKCGNDEAYFWSKQMRASDEPETQFFKCTKCSVVDKVDK